VGLTGASATGGTGPKTILRDRGGLVEDVIGPEDTNAGVADSRAARPSATQSAIIVGGIVANVAVSRINQGGNE